MMNSLSVVLSVLFYFILPVVQDKLPDLTTLCPYNDFCTTNATKTLPANETDLIPCCQKCSCEPDCQLFGNCCPDKELTPDVQVKYPCVSLDDYYNKPRNIIAKSQIKISYHVINDCPTVISSYKYPRCSLPSDLEDYVFVSDPETGRVYQNKHCAMCHGVQHYTEWLIVTDCPFDSLGLKRDEWFSHVVKFCGITPMPPDSKAGQAFQCYKPVEQTHIKKCNDVTSGGIIDVDIKEACESENTQTNSMFIEKDSSYSFRTIFISYENAFCKLCNIVANEEWPELCINVLSASLQLKTVSRLSVIINFKRVEETSQASQCKQGQIWDPFQTTCIDVKCPAYSALVAGKCEDMYRGLVPSEGVYVIDFRIMGVNESTIVWADIINDLHVTVTEMINNGHCLQCESSIYRHSKNLNYYFTYRLRTSINCSMSFLISRIRKWLKNPYDFYNVKIYSNITLIPEFDLDTLIHTMYRVADLIKVNECPIATRINWKDIDRCPRLPLSYTNINTSTVFVETERNNTICVHEYFKIMRAMNLSNISRQNYWMIVFVMIICFNATW